MTSGSINKYDLRSPWFLNWEVEVVFASVRGIEFQTFGAIYDMGTVCSRLIYINLFCFLLSSYQSGDVFPEGVTIVTFTATDSSGSSSSCDIYVAVRGI